MASEPTFLYPRSRQFPFDEVCERIVRALEERNWSVPGVKVEFDVYGGGSQQYRLVRNVQGDDFRLQFGRVQANMGKWNDTAAVNEIVIPGKDLHVYESESGLTLFVYVGRSWRRDREAFINHSKVNSKLKGAPRTYLKYSGSCDCRAVEMPHTHDRRRPPVLLHDNDLGREYSPRMREPVSYRTDDVFWEFTKWLRRELLGKILARPKP